MKRFPCAHATHPQWAMAVGLTLAQLRAHMALPDYARVPALGLVYITDHYAAHAARILDRLAAELPGVSDWAGATGVGVCATGAEYLDEPAISVLLCDLPRDQYRVYSGVAPLPSAIRFRPQMALVHADGDTPDLPDLIGELAGRTERGYLFGGIAANRAGGAVQFAWSGSSQGGQKQRGDSESSGGADAPGGVPGVFTGGLSGVAFARGITLASRITQGCQPVAPEHRVTAAEDNVILTLDGQPALDVLLGDLMLDPSRPRQALPVLRQTLAGLASPGEGGVRRTGDFGPGVRVRQLIGIDPGRRAVIVADEAPPGLRLAFCQRNAQAARADLVRICAEIREALEPQEALAAISSAEAGDAASAGRARILGAHYVSCAGRGGPHFGGPGAELHIIRQALGDVPLTGFFAGGEIAHHNLHRYAGVLTVFAEGAGAAGQST